MRIGVEKLQGNVAKLPSTESIHSAPVFPSFRKNHSSLVSLTAGQEQTEEKNYKGLVKHVHRRLSPLPLLQRYHYLSAHAWIKVFKHGFEVRMLTSGFK